MSVIKRYANRKLYDTRAKQYVTLDALAELIRQGDDLAVIDHPTGEDITVLTLAQIIVEQEKRERGGLPQSVLKGMIQASSRALSQLRWVLPRALNQPSAFELEFKRRVETLVERGVMTEIEAAQLAAHLASAAEADVVDAHEVETDLQTRLAARGVPTRADVHTLATQLDSVAANLDRWLATAKPPTP